jgi:hypothetical protein
MLETIQGVHAFAGSAATFFVPALATGLWPFPGQELLSQSFHMLTLLNLIKSCCSQFKLVATIVDNFVIG